MSYWLLLFMLILPPPCLSLLPKVSQLERKSSTSWTRWELCPEGTAVIGMSFLLSNHTPDTLKGVKLACKVKNYTSVITAQAPGVSGAYRPWKECGDRGMAVGLQQKMSGNIWTPDEKKVLGEKIPETWETGIVEYVLYCENLRELTKLDDLSNNTLISPANWRRPALCGWGEFICAVRAQFSGPGMDKLINIQVRCCPRFESSDIHWKSNRMHGGLTLNSDVSSTRIESLTTGRIYYHHFTSDLDVPYYFKWKFCGPGQYVTGMQLQYGKRALGLLCSDMSRPQPRMPEVIQMNGGEAAWEMSGDDLSAQVECEGVGIGFQVKYFEKWGIQAIRLICSYTNGPEDQLSYVESRFRPLGNGTGKADAEEGKREWQDPQLCDRNQAICGFKAFTHAFGEHKDLLEHVKVKCCDVPEIADVCFPSDRYELVVECDATWALGDTVCNFIQSEGISIASTRTESQMRDLEFHQSLGREWSVTQGQSEKDSQGISTEYTLTNKTGTGITKKEEWWVGREDAVGKEVNVVNGTTNANTRATGTSRKTEQTEAENQGGESGRTRGLTHSRGENVGATRSDSKGHSTGSMQSLNKMSGKGLTEENSESLTEGISSGKLKAKMIGKSDTSSSSDTEGSSNTNTRSNTQRDTRTSSTMHGWGAKIGIEAEAGFNVGFASGKVKTSFEASYTGSTTSGSENTRESSESSASEQSKSKTRGSASELSSQNTDQETEEKSKTGVKGKSKEVRKDETKTVGNEVTSGQTSEVKMEKNVQTNQNVEVEDSETEMKRFNVEKTSAKGLDVNEEETKVDTVERREEAKKTMLTTKNREDSVQTSIDSEIERGVQLGKGRTSDTTLENIKSNLDGGVANRGKKFTTGFDWGKASTSTWNLQRSSEVRMLVPPGLKTRLFQAVGHCAFYTVKASLYRRVDTSVFGVKRAVRVEGGELNSQGQKLLISSELPLVAPA